MFFWIKYSNIYVHRSIYLFFYIFLFCCGNSFFFLFNFQHISARPYYCILIQQNYYEEKKKRIAYIHHNSTFIANSWLNFCIVNIYFKYGFRYHACDTHTYCYCWRWTIFALIMLIKYYNFNSVLSNKFHIILFSI